MNIFWPFLIAAIFCCIFSSQIDQVFKKSRTVKEILIVLCVVLVLISMVLVIDTLVSAF